ncbi:oxygenase MpaB family protein [Microbacterium sediminicola]|uniref:Oxygenase MpaB family protein n=1 Tax=Microbacterium sediminicola TaxID=415210 RepID=A0ABP4U2P8_9MICO
MTSEPSSPPAAAATPRRRSREELDALDSSFLARSLLLTGTLSGTANVIMQLANPAVGYGVARSTVENGRLDKHPIKRARTTLSYLAVAVLGNAEDRKRYRKAVTGQHAQVRSSGDSPVEYNAMNPELQRWVAACLYYGAEETYQLVYGPLEGADRERFYQQGMVLGTTLQMPAELWPEDRAAFERYWNEQVAKISISDEIRAFLLGVAWTEYAPERIRKRIAEDKYRRTIGYLPPVFRAALRVDWTATDQVWFDEYLAEAIRKERRRPLWVSQLGYRLLLWDVRVRYRMGRRLV